MRKRKHILCSLLAISLMTACTQDELVNDTRLPEGQYPLELTAGGMTDVAVPATRGTLDGNWQDVQTVAVKEGDVIKEYSVIPSADYATAALTSNDPFWWTNAEETKTILAWYPYSDAMPERWEVPADQTNGLPAEKDLMLAKGDISFNDRDNTTLNFEHQLSKVVINIKESDYLKRYGNALSVKLTNLMTIGRVDTYFMLNEDFTASRLEVTPHRLETLAEGAFASFEAFVIPQNVGTVFPRPEIVIKVGDAKYTTEMRLDGRVMNIYSGVMHVYTITVNEKGLEVQVSESINWGNGATGSGSITLEDYTYDESTKTYTVYTAEGLNKWAEAANKDLSTSCTLMADIDLSGVNWEPVAFGDDNIHYTGTFDGNGHTISNLTITKENLSWDDDCGMFGLVGANATIKNLTLENVSLNTSIDEAEFPMIGIGALAGANQGTISNCNVSGNISINSGAYHVGGIVGRMDSGVIQYCHSSASIQGGNSTYVGGVLGGEYATATVIKGCSFSGSITSDRAIGGVAGYCRFFNDMIGCYSVGELSNLSTTAYRTGGVVGFLQFNTTANACYWSNFDGVGVGYCNENNQWAGAYKVDGEAITWEQAMNEALGTDAAYLWHTDDPNTPPTLVPNN